MQGARSDGMAHAISSFAQRCRWAAPAVFLRVVVGDGHDTAAVV